MSNITLPKNNKFVENMLFGWFGGWAGYLEYQKSKKIADAMADNEANKIRLAGEIEEKVIREQIILIATLEQADRYSEYRNLYSVLTRAVPHIQYNGDDMPIDPDKLKRLKDLSKEFESDDLQEIIAKILAGEYNNPGSYALQTMSVVKNLSKSDIELFRKAAGLIINNSFLFSFLFSVGRDTKMTIKAEGFTYDNYLYLRELGLLSSIESGSEVPIGNRKFTIGDRLLTLNAGKKITLVGQVFLTKAGKELFQLIQPINNYVFFLLIKEEFLKQGFTEIQ